MAVMRSVALLAAAAVTLHAGPGITAIGPVRAALAPDLAGAGKPGHVALTFDDGPDPASTPAFLDLLAARDLRATFFLLGRMVDRTPDLARRIIDAGHEVAVHGYDHRMLLFRGPRSTMDDLGRAVTVIGAATGVTPTLFRPPYGVLTTSAIVAAKRLGLRPVLWTAWGRDWTAHATGESVTFDCPQGTQIRRYDPAARLRLHSCPWLVA